jgi:hypothetical protein
VFHSEPAALSLGERAVSPTQPRVQPKMWEALILKGEVYNFESMFF